MLIDRGYTGHEHLHRVALIHMNGRLYDPAMHRFLQPDNYVQEPNNTQNYSRYSYVLNNPLKYTDPTGEEFITMFLISVAVSVVMNTIADLGADKPITFASFTRNLFFAALSSAATAGIGTGVEQIGNFWLKTAVAAVLHGSFQGGMSAAQGGEFWNGFWAGSISSLAASFWQSGGTTAKEGVKAHQGLSGYLKATGDTATILFGTVAGGAGASLTGGNFWKGAATGFIVSGLNHAMHKMGDGTPKPKFRWRHLLGPDAVYVALAEDLGIGLGVGFEQGAIIILRGPDAGIYPAYDFGIGLPTASGSLSLQAVKLYYSGDTVTKDVFYGNRYEANFGADALGHIGFTGVYAPMADGNMVWGYGITIGVGFSATIFSGNINYGRTQTNGNNMIPNLVNKK